MNIDFLYQLYKHCDIKSIINILNTNKTNLDIGRHESFWFMYYQHQQLLYPFKSYHQPQQWIRDINVSFYIDFLDKPVPKQFTLAKLKMYINQELRLNRLNLQNNFIQIYQKQQKYKLCYHVDNGINYITLNKQECHDLLYQILEKKIAIHKIFALQVD
jgi:hypothetical protein